MTPPPHSCTASRPPQGAAAAESVRGFSLIELLTVLLIVGLLASLAWPSYRSYLQRSHRAQAAAALLQAQQFMERYFSVQGSYLGAAGQKPSLPAALQAVIVDGQTLYLLQIEQADAVSYQLRAQPQGAMSSDPCAALTLSHTGLKGRSGSTATAQECWR
ncbi:MAG: type IV pilin protein [Betaproteobacteria bacterium]